MTAEYKVHLKHILCACGGEHGIKGVTLDTLESYRETHGCAVSQHTYVTRIYSLYLLDGREKYVDVLADCVRT